MICEECGMQNKTRKCNLCGHVSNKASNKSKSSSNVIRDKASKYWTPAPLEHRYNKVVRVIQIMIVTIMIINAWSMLYYTSFLDDFVLVSTKKMDSNTTSIHVQSKLMKDYISDYIPDKINSAGGETFYMPLFETEYEVEAEITCSLGEWHDIYIQLYDVDHEEVDPYLRDLFFEYHGEYIEPYGEYECERWQFADGISIELYFNQYIDDGQYYSCMFIINDNCYSHELEQ